MLSTLLFNVVLQWIVRRTDKRGGIRMAEEMVNIVAYADDVDLMAEKIEDLRETVESFVLAARVVGLEVNVNKTKLVRVDRRQAEQVGEELYIGGERVEEVESFKYLGGQVSARRKASEEVLERVASGNRSFFSLKDIFNSRELTRSMKVEVYKVMIRPVVTYGLETSCMTLEMERRLNVFENTILRRICGPVYDVEDGKWRRRHNVEIREMTGVPWLSDVVKSSKLRWAGHVARMEEGRMPKRLMNWIPEGRRPRGRPRMRWEDGVRSAVTDDQEWREVAEDRDRWKILVEAAMSRRARELQE